MTLMRRKVYRAGPATGSQPTEASLPGVSAGPHPVRTPREHPLRIVLLDTSNPERMTGGQSVFIRTLLPRLEGDIAVVGVADRGERLGVWYQRILRDAPYRFMAVARMTRPGRRPLVPLRLRACLGVARFRRRVVASGDVMYVQSPEMGLALTCGPVRKPIILHLHGSANPLSVSRYPWARNRLLEHVYALILKRVVGVARLVFSVDEAGLAVARRYLHEERTSRLVRVPICVDDGLFRPGDKAAARAALRLPPTTRLVTFVGRLERAKGTDMLIDVLALLVGRGEHVLLAVVGDGSQRAAMRGRAQARGIADHLVMPGWVEHDDLPAWLRASDVLLLPSAHEGLTTAVVEALACGVPVVATEVGGLAQVIEPGRNGLLVRDRSPEAFAAAVVRVLHGHWPSADLAASVRPYSADEIASFAGDLLAQVVDPERA